MSDIKGKSIRIFLVDGTPQAILTAEIVNWTGHVLSSSRTKLAELLKRPEMDRAGIYFLTGPDPEGSGRTFVYIGESDNVGNRLTQHNRDEAKDFWEKSCIITSKDQNLTKAHIRYLESRLLAIVRKSGLVKLLNGTDPIYTNLPEADIADMEYFISQVRLILPVLGLDFLKEHTALPEKQPVGVQSLQVQPTNASPIFELISRKHNLTATAQQIDGEFIVMAGSSSRAAWEGTQGHNYHPLYDTMKEQGKIVVPPTSSIAIFQEDVPFSSPSTAAAVVLGRASNGRTKWRVRDTGMTYADWQNSLLPVVKEETV